MFIPYIMTALQYIKNECASHTDEKADEKGVKDVCDGCPFNGIDDWCFFQAPHFEGKTPEEWNLEKLEELLVNQQKGE